MSYRKVIARDSSNRDIVCELERVDYASAADPAGEYGMLRVICNGKMVLTLTDNGLAVVREDNLTDLGFNVEVLRGQMR